MLGISLVLYRTCFSDIERIVKTIENISIDKVLYIIDNSPTPCLNEAFLQNKEFVIYKHTNKNIGYGKAHNIAFRESIQNNLKYHLVINPDLYFDSYAILDILKFLDKNKEVGHLMPMIKYPNDEIQRVAKLLPTPVDLLFRGFFHKKLYVERDKKLTLFDYKYDRVLNVPFLSGCFMFLRVSVLKEIGLFDERFFMYAEDLDLTRRIHMKYKTIVYPSITVFHRHEKASSKSLRMKYIHMLSLFKYFNKYGWCFDPNRNKINQDVNNVLYTKV